MANPGFLSKALMEVDPNKETAAGQMPSILSSGNPLMKQAETQAKQDANRRGVLNSTMAVQAGQGAVLNAAVPLAADAASTYRDQKRTNQGFLAQSGILDQNFENTKSLNEQNYGFNRGLNEQGFGFNKLLNQQQGDITAKRDETLFGYDTKRMGLQAGYDAEGDVRRGNIQSGIINTQGDVDIRKMTTQAGFDTTRDERLHGFKIDELNIDTDNRIKIENVVFEHQETLQSNAGAQNLYGTFLNNVSSIYSNPELSETQQNAGVAEQLKYLGNGLKMITSIPPDLIDMSLGTGTSGSSTQNSSGSPTTGNPPAVMGGMAPGQQGFGKDVDLSPGKFIGEIKVIKLPGTRDPKGNVVGGGEARVQWTNEGWVRV